MSWVKFKNEKSSNLKLTVTSIGRRQRAEEQIDEYEIPYRNDNLIIHNNVYKPYIRQMEFAFKDKSKLPLIYTWLTGRGKLRTSNDTGGYFIASIVNAINTQKLSRLFDSCSVNFKVNPFFYLDSGDEALNIQAATTIINPGTFYSDPYIKISGTGNVDLCINSRVYSFVGIDRYIEIDSDLKIVYKDTLNQGSKMTGDFPILEVGENAIAWTGNVTNIEIIPKWREL